MESPALNSFLPPVLFCLKISWNRDSHENEVAMNMSISREGSSKNFILFYLWRALHQFERNRLQLVLTSKHLGVFLFTAKWSWQNIKAVRRQEKNGEKKMSSKSSFFLFWPAVLKKVVSDDLHTKVNAVTESEFVKRKNVIPLVYELSFFNIYI